jgi:2-iminobutanoate/2-iminopropanoate deaminase
MADAGRTWEDAVPEGRPYTDGGGEMPHWKRINAPELPKLPVFAHAAVAGNHIYVSGMLGLKDDFSGAVDGGIAAETMQSLRHVERILRACDAALTDLVKVSVYMPDLGEWDEMNRAYMEALGPHTPARIAVGCAALLFNARVELDCVAYRS